jgi:MerR family transcriptional regulator, light-induced transcriptional regulator
MEPTTVNDRNAVQPITVSIAAVERDTGLSKDTLRVWERRYGFPVPQRDAFGERAYPLEQIEKLRVIKRLLDAGHRPGRIASMDIASLLILGESLSAAPQRLSQDPSQGLASYMALIKSHNTSGLRRSLQLACLRMGLVCNIIAPLNVMVGDAWMRGQLEIFEEHMYTESVQHVLRQAIAHAAPDGTTKPRVLLTTFPQEPHSLGLLMAEAMLNVEGCCCMSLGTQTPILDIVLAATAYHSDIVALSFTASQNPNYVVNGLEELRQKLPQSVEIWVGGSCPVVYRKQIDGVKPMSELGSIHTTVQQWRAQRIQPRAPGSALY